MKIMGLVTWIIGMFMMFREEIGIKSNTLSINDLSGLVLMGFGLTWRFLGNKK